MAQILFDQKEININILKSCYSGCLLILNPGPMAILGISKEKNQKQIQHNAANIFTPETEEVNPMNILYGLTCEAI